MAVFSIVAQLESLEARRLGSLGAGRLKGGEA
jgi:hypothetical protein